MVSVIGLYAVHAFVGVLTGRAEEMARCVCARTSVDRERKMGYALGVVDDIGSATPPSVSAASSTLFSSASVSGDSDASDDRGA